MLPLELERSPQTDSTHFAQLVLEATLWLQPQLVRLSEVTDLTSQFLHHGVSASQHGGTDP